MKLYLRDHYIKTTNGNPDLSTSVFEAFAVNQSLFAHTDGCMDESDDQRGVDFANYLDEQSLFIVHCSYDRRQLWIEATAGKPVHVVFEVR